MMSIIVACSIRFFEALPSCASGIPFVIVSSKQIFMAKEKGLSEKKGNPWMNGPDKKKKSVESGGNKEGVKETSTKEKKDNDDQAQQE
jgi:hypothetical protein